MITNWQQFIAVEQQQPYYQELIQSIAAERARGKTILPPEKQLFNAFVVTPLDRVKVVILGQDPYHGPNQAHGLSFSVQAGVKVPPSLKNIYKELAEDIEGFEIPTHGELTAWAKQGVLLLNTVLTVEQGKANSHAKLGWEQFTTNALKLLNSQDRPIIFLLWGAHAIKKGKAITNPIHHILSGPHPSPLAAYRGFFGCRHFSKVNEIIVSQGESVIDWQV